MAFNTVYKQNEERRPVWDAASARQRVMLNTSRSVAIRFAHDRALDRSAAQHDERAALRADRSDDVAPA